MNLIRLTDTVINLGNVTHIELYEPDEDLEPSAIVHFNTGDDLEIKGKDFHDLELYILKNAENLSR